MSDRPVRDVIGVADRERFASSIGDHFCARVA
jgi:hypothetical protein